MYGMFLTYHEMDALEDVLSSVSSRFAPIARSLARSVGSYRLKRDSRENPGKPLRHQAGSSRAVRSQPLELDADKSNTLTTKQSFEEGHSSGYSSDNSIDVGESHTIRSVSLSGRELPAMTNRKVPARVSNHL